MNRLRSVFACLTFVISTPSLAEGWCDIQPGFLFATHGNMGNEAYILATLPGASQTIWITITTNDFGKANVALALAAQLSGKGVSIYLDDASMTCATYPSWSASPIRHMRIIN
jgi:hypothetical protein